MTTLPPDSPPHPARGRLTLAWIALALSVAWHAATLVALFTFSCHAGTAFAAYLIGIGFSVLAPVITLVQQIRTPTGQHRWMQATALYVLSVLLWGWAVLSLLPLAMSFDSC